jgi:hypothetical protein
MIIRGKFVAHGFVEIPMIVREIGAGMAVLVASAFVWQATKWWRSGQIKALRGRHGRTAGPSVIYRNVNPGMFWCLVWVNYLGAVVVLVLGILLLTGTLEAWNKRALYGPAGVPAPVGQHATTRR